jgi:hypothetical protein
MSRRKWRAYTTHFGPPDRARSPSPNAVHSPPEQSAPLFEQGLRHLTVTGRGRLLGKTIRPVRRSRFSSRPYPARISALSASAVVSPNVNVEPEQEEDRRKS